VVLLSNIPGYDCWVPLSTVLRIIGHDGSELIWPKYSEPYCRRGFAINEIVYAALNLGIALVDVSQSIKFHPYGEEDGSITIEANPNFESDMLLRYDAILLGESMNGVSHAVAWNFQRQLVYDPAGTRYPCNLFKRESILVAFRIGTKIREEIRQESREGPGPVCSGSPVPTSIGVPEKYDWGGVDY
jgi:hypothetical protein